MCLPSRAGRTASRQVLIVVSLWSLVVSYKKPSHASQRRTENLNLNILLNHEKPIIYYVTFM